MPRRSPVRSRVPGKRIVAATDVTAGRTPPQVYPPTAGGAHSAQPTPLGGTDGFEQQQYRQDITWRFL